MKRDRLRGVLWKGVIFILPFFNKLSTLVILAGRRSVRTLALQSLQCDEGKISSKDQAGSLERCLPISFPFED